MSNNSPALEGPVLEPEVKTIGSYGKTLNATIILVLGVFVTALTDGNINTVEWIMAGIALLRGLLLFGVRPEWGKFGKYLPLILTAVIGAATQLITALQDGGGLSTSEIVSVLIVFFSALGSTVATSNAAFSDRLARPSNRAELPV